MPAGQYPKTSSINLLPVPPLLNTASSGLTWSDRLSITSLYNICLSSSPGATQICMLLGVISCRSLFLGSSFRSYFIALLCTSFLNLPCLLCFFALHSPNTGLTFTQVVNMNSGTLWELPSIFSSITSVLTKLKGKPGRKRAGFIKSELFTYRFLPVFSWKGLHVGEKSNYGVHSQEDPGIAPISSSLPPPSDGTLAAVFTLLCTVQA